METPTENTKTSLVDLTGHVDEKIIALLSPTIKDFQAILNLRRVCKATKSWVDMPESHSLHEGKRVLEGVRMVMEADFPTLLDFLESPFPPGPSGISSLTLDVSLLPESTRDHSCEALWDEFVLYWAPKLRDLELRSTNPRRLNSDMKKILNCPDLETLKLPSLDYGSIPFEDLPTSFFNVRELSVSRLGHMSKATRAQLYFELGKNMKLKKFDVCIEDRYDLQCLIVLIWKKRSDPDFSLNIHHLDSVLGRRRRRVSEEIKDLLLKFACRVVRTKSKIRTNLKYGLRFIRLIERIFEEAEFEIEDSTDKMISFMNTIESIECPVYCEKLCVYDEFLKNLKSVRIRSDILPNDLSETIERLWLFDYALPQNIAPVNLTYLHVSNVRCDIGHFIFMIDELASYCEKLESFHVEWNAEADVSHWVRQGWDTRTEEYMNGNRAVLSNLRSLSFGAKLHAKICTYDEHLAENRLEAVKTVLIRGFRVRILQLTHLRLFKDMTVKGVKGTGIRGRSHYAVLDAEIMKELCEGKCGETLVMTDIEKECVVKEDLPKLEELESLAKANWTRRVETEGRGKWMRLHEI